MFLWRLRSKSGVVYDGTLKDFQRLEYSVKNFMLSQNEKWYQKEIVILYRKSWWFEILIVEFLPGSDEN